MDFQDDMAMKDIIMMVMMYPTFGQCQNPFRPCFSRTIAARPCTAFGPWSGGVEMRISWKPSQEKLGSLGHGTSRDHLGVPVN